MGNGSIYFWNKEQTVVKSVCGHTGSVSALCNRRIGKKNTFISGDKSGKIILWNEKF
jgi:hypothetical protein